MIADAADGVRTVGYLDGGRFRLMPSNDHDITAAYPAMVSKHALDPDRPRGGNPATRHGIVVDGEIVAFDLLHLADRDLVAPVCSLAWDTGDGHRFVGSVCGIS